MVLFNVCGRGSCILWRQSVLASISKLHGVEVISHDKTVLKFTVIIPQSFYTLLRFSTPSRLSLYHVLM